MSQGEHIIQIAQSTKESPIEKRVLDAVNGILDWMRDENGAEYNDSTYKDLYIISMDFAKRLTDMISSQNVTQYDRPMCTTPDTTYFSHQQQIH